MVGQGPPRQGAQDRQWGAGGVARHLGMGVGRLPIFYLYSILLYILHILQYFTRIIRMSILYRKYIEEYTVKYIEEYTVKYIGNLPTLDRHPAV